MSNGSSDGMPMWLAIGVIAVAIVGSVYTCLNMPTAEDCRREAERRGIPCEYHSVQWDEDECECIHATEYYEIEFEIPARGCEY